jgi:hypothetical protein
MKLQIFVAGAISAISCCSAVFAQDATAVEVGKVLDEETRVFAGPCIFQAKKPEPPDVTRPPPVQPSIMAAGPFIGAIAETFLDFGVAALKAAAEEKTAQAITAFPVNTWMYQLNATAQLVINPKASCIQIISGSFRDGLLVLPSETNKVEDVAARDDSAKVEAKKRERTTEKDSAGKEVSIAHWAQEKNIDEQLQQRFRQLRSARFLMEVRVEQLENTDDKFYLAPSAFYFANPVQSSWLDFKGRRNILVTVTLAPAGESDDKVIASIAMPFRDVSPGTRLTPLYFEGQSSRALKAPALGDADRKDVDAKQALYEAAKRDVSLAQGSTPRAPQPINTVRDPEYLRSAQQYCQAVDKYNAERKKAKSKADEATPPECPVEVLVAQSELDTATKVFRDATARRQAKLNADTLWKDGSGGVKCTPGAGGTQASTPSCKLKSPEMDVGAITISATVVEIKEASKFVAFLGNVAEKVKPTVKAAVDASLPAGKAKAEEDQRKAKEDLESLKLDVAVAEVTLANAKSDADIAQSKKTVYDKKVLANRKAREANLPEPYPLP